jgi:hypothetical protein
MPLNNPSNNRFSQPIINPSNQLHFGGGPTGNVDPNTGQPIDPNTGQPLPNGGGGVGQPGGGQSPASPSPFDTFKNALTSTPYGSSPALQNILSQFQNSSALISPAVAQQYASDISGYVDKFTQQYSNATGGTPPSQDQINTFLQNAVVPLQIQNIKNAGPETVQASNASVDNAIQGLLKDTFSTDIQNANTQQLQNTANKAVAPGSAFDTWQQAYQGSIGDVTKTLQNYQQQLFQKLQPNLITSLQSKGLLDSGALNQAFAGAATDLGNAAQGYVAGIQGQADQDIANQRFNIQNAPNASAIANWSAQIPNLTQAGQGALNNAFNYDTSLYGANLNNYYGQQAYNQQQSGATNPLSQYAGMIIGGGLSGLAGGIGSGIGAQIGKNIATPNQPTV